jgi:TRAP-type C4-dicarboxylate transport system permease small subunit
MSTLEIERRPADRADRVGAAYDAVVKNLVFLALATMVVVSFLGVVTRYLAPYVPDLPTLFWAEEVTRYAAQWMVYLVSGLAIRWGVHLAVDTFVAWLPRRARLAVLLLGHGLIVFLLLFLLYFGVAMILVNTEQRSSALQLPMGYVFAAIPVGAVLMLVEEARAVVTVWRTRGQLSQAVAKVQ